MRLRVFLALGVRASALEDMPPRKGGAQLVMGRQEGAGPPKTWNRGCTSCGMDHPFRSSGPALLLCIPLLLGFFLGLAAGSGIAAAAAGFVTLSFVLVGRRTVPLASACAVAALCGVLGAARMSLVAPGGVRPFLGREVVLRGEVYQVRPDDAGWSGVVEDAVVSRIDGSGVLRLGRVLFSVRNPDWSGSFPAEVRATGRLHAIRSRGNPGELPREWTALASGAQYRFGTDASRCVFLPLRGSDRGVRALFARARARTGRWLAANAGSSDGALYLRAIATGERPPSSHPMVALLRRTGLAHLLAISGLHVVLLFSVQALCFRLVVWLLRRRRGVPALPGIAAFLSLPGCWGYVLLAGAPVSAVRAAGMLTVAVFLRCALGVRGSGAAWTALALLTLAKAPSSVFSPSFLLSYGASFFLIVAFGERGGRQAPHGRPRLLRGIVAWTRASLIGSATVVAGTLPVSAAFFRGFPAGAILWNVLFVPVLGPAGVVGALLAVAGGAFSVDAVGGPVRIVERFLCGAFALLSHLSQNGSWWYPLPPSGFAAPLACTGAAAYGSLRLRARGCEPWPAVAAAAVAFLVWIHVPYAALPDHRLTIAALNVGRGAAQVISLPGGGHVMVDCGSGQYGNAGANVVLPYLRGRGIHRLDVLVLTHPHEDHYGGAEAVLADMPVGEIWILEGMHPSAFGEAVGRAGGRVRWKAPGDRLISGGAEIVVRGSGPRPFPQSANERSLMLEVRYRSFDAWLPGDVERGPIAWGRPASPRGAERRVLFLPHHGSPGARPGAWIRAASPRAVISQNSDCFKKGNLVPSVKSFFLENGAVTMRSDGKTVTVEQARRPGLWELLLRLPPEG